jgi:hypothetical protein
MLKQLAPKVVIPPSPKNKHWINRATDRDKMETNGPRRTVDIPIPTACAVVPPGTGRLNIMITKENATKTASRGTVRVVRVFRIRFRATYQNGAAAP